MKLLLDNNLSPRLVSLLAGQFSTILHVRALNLASAVDRQVWDYARTNDYVIVSKDADFHQMSFLFGAPPKVIWIRRGNCTTDELAKLLQDRISEILAFEREERATFLALS